MIRQAIYSGMAVLAGWTAWSAVGPGPSCRAAAPAAKPAGGVAVVEAYVSQGCNYCPPAERLLAGVADAARRRGQAVYLLAFHVDYFDGSWKDPFDSPAYTARQRAYADTLGGGGPFTPQTVVNGSAQCVGTDRAATDAAVTAALATPPAVTVTAAVTGSVKAGLHVRPTLAGTAGAAAVVAVAVVEQGLSSDIRAGENAGVHIDEPSVVRWFKTVPVADAADVAVPALPGVRADHASVVVFVQAKPAGAVLGATAAPLP